jgi:hypothetical protein
VIIDGAGVIALYLLVLYWTLDDLVISSGGPGSISHTHMPAPQIFLSCPL